MFLGLMGTQLPKRDIVFGLKAFYSTILDSWPGSSVGRAED